MNIPDRVTVVRRNPDGTESSREIPGCDLVPNVVHAAPVGDMSGWRSLGTLAGPIEFRRTPDDGEPLQFGTDYTVGDRFPPEPAAQPSAPESDVLAAIEQLERDEIDDLVDFQLRREPSGYDHNINQLTCIHCGDDRHSVPITKRMQQMRRLFRSTISYYEGEPRASDEVVAQLDAYRYDQDDSPIVCPGSEFVGAPKPPAWKLERARRAAERERAITEYLSGDPSYERLRCPVEGGRLIGPLETLGCFYAGLPLPELEDDTSPWVDVPFGPFARMTSVQLSVDQIADGFRRVGEQIRETLAPVADAFSAAANSMMDLWSFTLPEEVQFPRSFVTWSAPHPSVSEWTRNLYASTRELQMHLYRNPTVVLMPDEHPHSHRLNAVFGIPVRYAPVAEGYVGYLHEASESGMGSAMCYYLALERAGTEPVIVASREAVQLTVRSERLFFEPCRIDFRDTAETGPMLSPRRLSELANMRVDERPSLGYVVVGYRMDVPSAEDIARELDPSFPDGHGITLRADPSRFRGASPSLTILDEVQRYTSTDEGANMIPDESFADPLPTNRAQRRGHREPSEPMWTRRLGQRGRNRR